MAVSQSTDLVLNGNLGELKRLAEETAQFCREHSLGPDVELDLNLVLEELFTNTLRHGGCVGGEHVAEVHFTNRADGVTVEYADRGAPFDPTTARTADLTAPLEERSIGGLGIHLIRQTMRDFVYQRLDGWNRIRIRLKSI